MALAAICSDLNGNIFSVDHRGFLYWNRHERRRSSEPWTHQGAGVQIGEGWRDIEHLFATNTDGRLLIGGVTNEGILVTVELPADTKDWKHIQYSMATQAQGSWVALRHVFLGNSGSVFGIKSSGEAFSAHLEVTTSSLGWSTLLPFPHHTPPRPSPVRFAPGTWNRLVWVDSNGEGILFGITDTGALVYRRLDSDGDWAVLARNWFIYQGVFIADRRSLYAVTSEGVVEVHRFTVLPNGQVELDPVVPILQVAEYICYWNGLPAAVEGYCWPLSVRPTETISFMVAQRMGPKIRQKRQLLSAQNLLRKDVDPNRYTVEFMRLRRMHRGVEGNHDQAQGSGPIMVAPKLEEPTGMEWLKKGADWPVSFQWTIPENWNSGLYSARLTDCVGEDFHIVFVVKPRERARSDFAILANTNTWNAYNNWGGYGKYYNPDPPTAPRTTVAPFHRPNPGTTPDSWGEGAGNTDWARLEVRNASRHLTRAELWVLGWLEENEYPYDVFADHDLHEGIDGLNKGGPMYKGLILSTHPEYWSAAMYDNAKSYLDRGGSIIYLGGNGVYEEISYRGDDDSVMQMFPGLNATVVTGSRHTMLRDPCLLRNRGRPERQLIGVGFEYYGHGDFKPYQLLIDPKEDPPHPLLKGLQRAKGDQFGQEGLNGSASGWEVDRARYDSGTPEQYEKIASGIPPGGADMIYYETGKGGIVFSAGSLAFGGSLMRDGDLQTIVRNALDLCLKTPART